MIPFARHFVDAVDVDGPQQVLLIHGQSVRLAVNLARAGENDLDVGVVFAAGFQNGKLRAAVDFQVGVRVLHRVHMAGLAGEIEEIILLLDQVAHAVFIAHVGDVDLDLVFDPVDVEQVAAVFRHQAVHKQNVCAERPRDGARGWTR